MVLKGNQRGLLGWAVEVFRGMEGGRLPGETEAEWRRERDGEVRRGVSYALTSLGAEVADARRLGKLLVGRWGIENGSFWVRDVLLREDGCQARGVGAWVLAVLRGYLVSLLHRKGVRGKKAALEVFSFHPLSALRFLGLYAE